MIKNKVKKFLAVALVIAATMSVGSNIVQASTMTREGNVIELASQTLKNGEYEVKNVVKYIDESNATGQSMARSSVEEKSTVIVKDDVITVTTYFNKSTFGMMKNFKVTMDGKELKAEVNNETKSITYEIPSLDSKVSIDMFIAMANKQVSFDLTNDLSTLNLVKEYETSQKVQNGNYTIKNDVKYVGTGNAEIGNQSARKTLKDTSDLTIKDGKYVLTLNFDESSFGFIGDVNVTVDGNKVEGNIDRDKAKVSFEIGSLDSKIDVSVFVTMMSRYTDFETILLKDTLTKVGSSDKEENDAVTGPSHSGSNNGSSNNGSSNSGSSNNASGNESNSSTSNETTTKKEEVVIVEGKLYTIENNVSQANPTGQAMARQYLEKESLLEEIDGKYYLTLTFTGMEYMSNHRFSINGSEVSAQATKIDDKTTKYRFQIPSLDASIKVVNYVAPMGRDVDFDVTLNKDSMKFVKEFTVEKLPQTGGALGSNALLAMGTTMLGAAGFLKRKKK